MKSIPLKQHLENRLVELKAERKSLKLQKERSMKESNEIEKILRNLEKINVVN